MRIIIQLPFIMLSDVSSSSVIDLCDSQPFAYNDHAQIYMFKNRQKVFKLHGTQHELDMMIAARECAVRLYERVILPNGGYIMGFTMALETPLATIAVNTSQRTSLVQSMISCVQALHGRGIVHGDIKPANMLYCSDGKIRLCDFAEARWIEDDPSKWNGSATTNYISPLRCQSWPQSPTPPPVQADDLYSLGLSIWELYTGTIPFDGVYEDDIIEKLKNGQTVNPREIEDKATVELICTYLRHGGVQI